MKKLLLASLLGLTALGLGASHAFAGLFRCNDCSKFSTFICIRPYNAFSPVCYGSITCQGSNPLYMCGGPLGAPPSLGPCCPGGPCGGMPSVFAPPSCYSTGCCDSGCLPAPGSVPTGNGPLVPEPMPQGPMAPPTFTPPMPMPLPAVSYYWPRPVAQSPVQTVGYQNAYYPRYNWGYVPVPAYYPMMNYYTPAMGCAPQGYAPAMAPAGNNVPGYWYGQQNYGR